MIHSVQPPFLLGGGGLNLQPNFQKGGGFDRTSTFGGVAGKEGGEFFQGGVHFSQKERN